VDQQQGMQQATSTDMSVSVIHFLFLLFLFIPEDI
jgi:hypothetical protein